MREVAIRMSRDLTRLSKQAIFDLHREDFASAKAQLEQGRGLLRELQKGKFGAAAASEGSFQSAQEEYLEATFFFDFLTKKELKRFPEPAARTTDVLGALADLSGELVRYAVKLVTRSGTQAVKEVEAMKKISEEIVGGLMRFHLTGKLRSKHDDAKRNLKRLEEILYDLRLRQ